MKANGTSSLMEVPNFDLTEDGRSFYIQQNLASPSFLVSTEEYDSFVLKGMIAQVVILIVTHKCKLGWMMICLDLQQAIKDQVYSKKMARWKNKSVCWN